MGWRKLGADVDDVNGAIAYTYDVAHPNAQRIVNLCRQLSLPLIFVHWGYRFRDGMDLDPAVRSSFLGLYGTDYAKWPHHISRRDSMPARILGVKPNDYVIAKTGQDALLSSNLRFVLENLEAKHIIFIGGHTGACLGRTASSAKRLGYKILCVEDATFAAWQSRKAADLKATGYDYLLTTEQFQNMVRTVIGHQTEAGNRDVSR
jgi:nicotinamidase-related amidase